MDSSKRKSVNRSNNASPLDSRLGSKSPNLKSVNDIGLKDPDRFSRSSAESDEEDEKQRIDILKRTESMKGEKEKTPIDKFIDSYWTKNLEKPNNDPEAKKESVGDIDLAVHKLIHEMIVMSEDDP